MKYIRTNDNKIYNANELIKCEDKRFPDGWFTKNRVPLIAIKQADTIEELCDERVIIDDIGNHILVKTPLEENWWKQHDEEYVQCFGAIWTDKGLIYVAKMNDKGELELL